MSVLDVQRKGQQIGRIRIGQQVAVIRDGRDTGKVRPDRLDTFRITTASRHTADAIAELFGGEVREWSRQWEVITRQSEISVMVPPRDAVVSQWYEMWSAGGCQRRCDSQHDQISNGPCLCPHADPADEKAVADAALKRAELAKLNPPQACKLVTRINVMIPDLPGLGVFRLDTGSFYAASEIGDTAALMQAARDKGVFIPAVLRIEQRQRVAGGQTKKYPVPVLEILATFRQIASGQLEAGGVAAQLPPAPGAARAAIAAGPAAPQAATAPVPQPPDGAPEIPQWLPVPDAASTPDAYAQLLAYAATDATTRADVRKIVAAAKTAEVADLMVCADDERDLFETLRAHLTSRLNALPEDGEGQ